MAKKTFKFQINFTNKWLYTLISLGVIILLGSVVYSYTGNVGHTSDQIDEIDPTVLASVKDGVDWSEVTGIPAGFADGVDDKGITNWSELVATGTVPAGFADGTDDVGSVIDNALVFANYCPYTPRGGCYNTHAGRPVLTKFEVGDGTYNIAYYEYTYRHGCCSGNDANERVYSRYNITSKTWISECTLFRYDQWGC